MFKSAELGHKIDKHVYDKEIPVLRKALLDAQFNLVNAANFQVIILVGGVAGAGRRETVEFGALGLVSGLLAASIATAGGWLVSSNLLDVPYRPDLRLWLGGVGGAVLLACLMGWSSTRRVIREPPLGVLRDP